MKKIMVAILMMLSVGVFAEYAYMTNAKDGKIWQFKSITPEQIAEYQGKGYTIETSRLVMYNRLVADGLKTFAEQQGITPTAQEKILAQSNFSKLDIRRAMRAMIISQTRIAAAVYGEPDIVTTVTNEAVLDALLTNETFKKDWQDATEINLDDAMVKQALTGANVDVNAVKLKILELPK